LSTGKLLKKIREKAWQNWARELRMAEGAGAYTSKSTEYFLEKRRACETDNKVRRCTSPYQSFPCVLSIKLITKLFCLLQTEGLYCSLTI
jgi:hypothetical protein